MGAVIKTPYGLPVIENCMTCPLHRDSLFCNLPQEALQQLDAISSSATYPKGAVLFVEGQEPHGVFILCHGTVKLTASSASGKSLILRFAEAGEVVGLPSTISGKPYELTGEAFEAIQANFIPRVAFLNFVKQHSQVAMRVAEMLSNIYHSTCREVRYLGLSASAEEKLARFVLDFTVKGVERNGELRATLSLTHDEIAEMLGLSRETVTRLFAVLKRKKLVSVKGSTLIVTNKSGLEQLIHV
jgi:CRP/FNR family cyclic AMP-dependent transcriptional regulator